MSDIRYTTLTKALCRPVVELLHISFPRMGPDDQYSVKELRDQVDVFPEGTIVALDGNRVVGMGTGIFVDIDFDNLPPTEEALLYSGDQTNHSYHGAYYFGSDMAVHPDYRGRGIAREIYNRRKELVVRHNKKGFAAAAVLRDFFSYKSEIDPHVYVARVLAGDIFDRTLSVQLRNGFEVVRLLHRFFSYPRSDHWSALILWTNPDYRLPAGGQEKRYVGS